MQEVLPDTGGIAIKLEGAVLALKFVIVLLLLYYLNMLPLWAPNSNQYVYIMRDWDARMLLGGWLVVGMVVGWAPAP